MKTTQLGTHGMHAAREECKAYLHKVHSGIMEMVIMTA